MNNLKFIVDEGTTGQSVRHILKGKLALSTNLITKLKKMNKICVNGIPSYINTIVNYGDLISVDIHLDDEVVDNILPENIPINILYEDEFLIVLNKQPNIVVHPTYNYPTGTIANALAYYFNEINIITKIRPVSRLDKDTSGIIIFAKNQYTHNNLSNQIKNNTLIKEYIGIVHGNVINDSGVIDLPIDRVPGSTILREVSDNGKRSITHYKVIRRYRDFSLINFTLHTGRTHQIRVHCKAIGHPLVGDTLYSHIPTDLINRQCLHSLKVTFLHPYNNNEVTLVAPLPCDFKSLMKFI